MEEPVCARCKATSSLMWEKNKDGEVLCLECHSSLRQDLVSDRPAAISSAPSSLSNLVSNNFTATTTETTSSVSTGSPSSTSETHPPPVTGRRTRLRNAKGRYGKAPASAAKNCASTTGASSTPSPGQASGGNQLSTTAPSVSQQAAQPTSTVESCTTGAGASHSKRGGGGGSSGRRLKHLLRAGKPTKAPAFDPTILTSDTVLHKGTRYEVGDIVSILDENGKTYYALLRGFLEDQYGEMYAALTWLVPTTPNPKDFDPSLFVLGPEEDSPKDMECLDFVTHSPQSASFLPSLARDLDLERLWSRSKRRRVIFNS